MDIITSDAAPVAIGPYSQAIRVGDLVFCSGQIGLDPATKELAGDDIESQIVQIFKNIRAILGEAGMYLSNIVKTTVFLVNMDDFPAMNALYEKLFAEHRPARSTIQVARLPMDALIEIESIAARDTE